MQKLINIKIEMILSSENNIESLCKRVDKNKT